jgi:hypothetical protein
MARVLDEMPLGALDVGLCASPRRSRGKGYSCRLQCYTACTRLDAAGFGTNLPNFQEIHKPPNLQFRFKIVLTIWIQISIHGHALVRLCLSRRVANL